FIGPPPSSIYTLSLHDALPIFSNAVVSNPIGSYTNRYKLESYFAQVTYDYDNTYFLSASARRDGSSRFVKDKWGNFGSIGAAWLDRKSTRLNSSHVKISYAVFC